jgi:2,3-bisphosphoglycerate-independent phosphoglycerate mutase
MLGHSGSVAATVSAVEQVDTSLGKIFSALNAMKESRRPAVFVTADHGNAEKMYDVKTGQPHTAHTSNPVPLILISDKWNLKVPSDYKLGLVDIAPTVLTIMRLRKPRAMTGMSIASPEPNPKGVKLFIEQRI